MGLLVTVLGGEETKEIVVTIEGLSSADKAAAFARGEDLRKGMKFAEAIKEYQKVVAGGEPCALEAEAQYDIGLCYTWLGERDKAEAVFQRMLQTYADNGEAVANAEYGLAWVEIQKGELDAAVARLERMLREQTCEDRELYARAQFQIGRIYLAFVHDYEEAQAAFRKLLANYPDSELVSHPFLDALRAER
jgi:tetratricopeptide (TPR) repeat protein